MMDLTGKPKILMIAFGHPDNVISLCKNISDTVDLSLVFVMSGACFQQGIININISNLKYGLNSKTDSIGVFPKLIIDYLGANFNLRIIRTNSRKILKDKYFKNLRSIISALLVLRKEGYNVIHFNGVSGFMFYFLPFFRKTKKIWTLHDFIPHSGEENRKSFMVQRLLAKLDFHFIQHYKYLQAMLIKVYNLPNTRVSQVYSGRLDIFNVYQPMQVNVNGRYILFFGRISKYKAIDLLINAFNSISNTNGVKLVIAGKGDLWFDKKSIEQNKEIIFINRYIETEELVYLIKNSLFVVIPYHDSTHSAVIVTAYAFYKTVIASNVSGIPEVVIDKKTGILVNKGNVDELRNAIEVLVNDDQLRFELETNIKFYCDNSEFSWYYIKKKMLAIYSQTINS